MAIQLHENIGKNLFIRTLERRNGLDMTKNKTTTVTAGSIFIFLFFASFTGQALGQEMILCFTDEYRQGFYQFESSDEVIAAGGPGYLH